MKKIIHLLMLAAVVSCGTARHIQPEQIHSVQVLAGPSASAYGSRGANGVIMFKSKAAYEAEQAELARRKAERQARKNK